MTTFPYILAAGGAGGHDLPLISTIAAAFTAAWICGIITHKLGLSPIVGYLIGGIAIGPHTPGFEGDKQIAPQLAEVGVILLMFGVGLHFHLKDLLAVKYVAVPGAIAQSTLATALGVAAAMAFGMGAQAGLVLGFALAVASTVVLIRVLTDARIMESTAGHVAIGWLIVEDLLTVLVLVLLPSIGTGGGDPTAVQRGFGMTLLIAFVKLAILVALLLGAGAKVIPWIMVRIARLRSRELFTLTVLVMAVAIAAGSYYAFGASMALGAFLAGMVVGQSPVSQQAAADALPLRNAFAVLFFTSVGMLFDPHIILTHPGLLATCLAIVLIGKPFAALVVVAMTGYPVKTALVVAIGLAQIGEFSFILSDLGRSYGLVKDEAHNVIVACAIVSITLNPILFRMRDRFEAVLQRQPTIWKWLNFRAERRAAKVNAKAEKKIEANEKPVAVVCGYGPVGRSVDQLLREAGLETVIVDQNVDTVQSLTKQGRLAIFGDASNVEVLAPALAKATHLIVTLPHSANRQPLIAAAKLIKPEIKIFVRSHYVRERDDLTAAGADAACFEEAEVAVALARLVLTDRGADDAAIRHETTKIRQTMNAESPMLQG